MTPIQRILTNAINKGSKVKTIGGAKRLATKAFNKASTRSVGTTSKYRKLGVAKIGGIDQLDPNAFYKSDYRSEIHPELSNTGTCDYCLRCNGRIFRGADLILPNGEYGHHPNCCCAFIPVGEEASPINNGMRNNTPGRTSNFGARKVITTKSLTKLPASTLQALANKRNVAISGNKTKLVSRILGRK
jgi:hypothetical protein